jgi:hypothetical protein
MLKVPQLKKGDRVRATDPEDGLVSILTVNGTPWFNKGDSQWYYPIQDEEGNQGDITDADISGDDVEVI